MDLKSKLLAAQNYFNNQEFDRAISLVDELLPLVPYRLQSHLYLLKAGCYAQIKDWNSAYTNCKIAQERGDAKASDLLAQIQEMQTFHASATPRN